MSAAMRLVIIGGSDAGVSAALRARELAPDADVTVLVADEFPNFSICGLPYLFSGEVPDWRTLAHRTLSELEASGAEFRTSTRAEEIDPVNRKVRALGPQGAATFTYDKLIIATGARPARPPILGIEADGVHVLHDMADAFSLRERLATARADSVIIIGGGYIGMEMADALRQAGIGVTIAERSSAPMRGLHRNLGDLLARAVVHGGTQLVSETRVTHIERRGDDLIVHGEPRFEASARAVLIAAGVIPNAELGARAGTEIGEHGAIRVNRQMESSVNNVYAAGDCVETWHHLLARPTYLPLGTTSHKQGRIAGENAIWGRAEFAGSLGTQVVKIFGKVVGRTGLTSEEASSAGFTSLTALFETWDHKVYFPGAQKLHVCIIGDVQSGKLLGAQIFGGQGSEVAKRLDVLATALHHNMSVAGLNDLDLSYTPPLSSPWDPVQSAAQHWQALRAKRL